jgi:hypothetical protein
LFWASHYDLRESEQAAGISTTFNGQIYFKQIAGSKVLDEYYNSYLRK